MKMFSSILVLAIALPSLCLARPAHAPKHPSTDPEQSWNQAVDARAHAEQEQEDIQDNAIKAQDKIERTQEALQLASQSTGEPAQAFTVKCVRDCTLKDSGTATFYAVLILQSRDKVCRYFAFGDNHGCGSLFNSCDQISGSVDCLDRTH